MYKTFSNNPESKELAYSIQKNQVDAMNGNIMVESKPNMGTTFKIYSMIKKENMGDRR
jgi:sensor histidine kinase regulating citrate/malate metabolism